MFTERLVILRDGGLSDCKPTRDGARDHKKRSFHRQADQAQIGSFFAVFVISADNYSGILR
ncbi:hypothetical protein, partial [Candidatus Amarolinea aalborgensis]|uniref:hypothetical protein n=1 Tax=Candidatus Amarolinea aalborgensis TaxID=2249329 RepID=UPI003BF9A558